MRYNESPSVAVKTETLSSGPLVGRQSALQAMKVRFRFGQWYLPEVHAIGRQRQGIGRIRPITLRQVNNM